MTQFEEARKLCEDAWGPGTYGCGSNIDIEWVDWGADPGVRISLVDDGTLRIQTHTGMTDRYMNPLHLDRYTWFMDHPIQIEDEHHRNPVSIEQAIIEATEWRNSRS